MNVLAGFRAIIPAVSTVPVLRLAGATLYRVSVNGAFLAHGPARAAHGFYRVDEIRLTSLGERECVVAIEVAGYNVDAYGVMNQPSFLQAEITSGPTVLAASGRGSDFACFLLDERVRRTERYSHQRGFTEAYRLTPQWDTWRRRPDTPRVVTDVAICEPKTLIHREAPYPDTTVCPVEAVVAAGTVQVHAPLPPRRTARYLDLDADTTAGFPRADLDVSVTAILRPLRFETQERAFVPIDPASSCALTAGTWRILDLGANRAGFIGLTVTCRDPVRLLLTFDERLTDGLIDDERNDCVNAVVYELAPGCYDVESFEPYVLRYLQLTALDGDCEIRSVYLRNLVCGYPDHIPFASGDPDLDRIFHAAVATFRQNAVDIIMDCPGRERAGWLCDSFFTARTEHALYGESRIEKSFLENFLLPESFGNLPDGMLPMCYPADFPNGRFIPNWALWLVVELEEYVGRSGDRELADAFLPKIDALFHYFEGFENGDGLLERLENWVFIEWSRANDYTQDLNYPSNMLYAGALSAAGRLFEDRSLQQKADGLREAVRRQAFDGAFFVDNAVAKDGRMWPSRNRTETCQYYAFYFDVATPDRYGELRDRLVRDFGPSRSQTGRYPDVHPASAFVGNVLRMDLLSRWDLVEQLFDEMKGYLLTMAEETGTLWEHQEATASCSHGFAAHAAYLLLRHAGRSK